MLRRLDELAAQRVSFAFESMLSARSSADIAVRRVAGRRALGGHGVPEDDLRRRYQRSIVNLAQLYLPLADDWEIYDKSGPPARLAATGRAGSTASILVEPVYRRIIPAS